MCHACENILEIMNKQEDAIVTDWNLSISKGCILFLFNMYFHTEVNLLQLTCSQSYCTSVT